MYGRRRSGGRGYRSNPMGPGAAFPRSSPDAPMRGGFYNSRYRNFDRGPPKFVHSPQPLRKGDLFMEAGRLAAEYLVAKGMLPRNALPPKFQNGGFKKEVGDFQQFREQDGENMMLYIEGRTSALARLGSFDGGSDRKRFPSDYTSAGSKHRGRRESGSYNHYDFDRGHENSRSGSMSGRSRASSEKEADDDALSVHHDEKLTTKDAGDDLQNVKAVELAPKSGDDGKAQSASDIYLPVSGLSSKTSWSAAGEDSQPVTSIEDHKESDDFGNFNVENGEDKESMNGEIGQHSPLEDVVIQPNQGVVTRSRKKGNDLLQLCNFTKVPTKTRSLRPRGLKGNQTTTTDEGNTSARTSIVIAKSTDADGIDRSMGSVSLEQTPVIEEHTSVGVGTVNGQEVPVDDNAVGVAKPNGVSDKNHDLTTNRILPANNSDQSFKDAILLDHDGVVEESKCLGSPSFPDRSFAYTQESNKGCEGGIDCGSLDDFVAVERRGEKRVLDESDAGATYKKPKVWSTSIINRADEYPLPHLSNLNTEEPTVIERTSPKNNLMMLGQESSSHIFGFTSTLGHANSISYAENKQIVDSSFKICDLNLMEGSDINENHDGSQMMFFSSISEIKKEPLPVTGGLSVCDDSHLSHNCNTFAAHGKEVELIDLENDFPSDGAFRAGKKREEAVYTTGLESYPSHARCPNGAADVHDGYGLMISELLGNDISNCSAVTGDISSLHNVMDLHNGQGMLPEDDPIYMTLGEIPIGFWEPHNPEFGKPF
ncbi:hypothetical protein QQ045_018163 [Rhodiola kirilowii]